MSDKTKKINRMIDMILLILFLVGSIYFLVEAILGELIPLKYILIAALIIVCLFIILFLSLKINHMIVYVLRKIVLIALCGVLVIGAVFQTQLRNAFMNVNDGSTSINRMYVLVPSSSSTQSIQDITSIGYVDELNDLVTYSLKELEDENLAEMSYESLSLAFDALETQEVDGILISEQSYTLECDKDESTIGSDYRIIHTIEKTTSTGQFQITKDLTEPFVVYVSGLDNIGEPNYNGLSDVNMLLMVDPQNHHVEIVSINRDTYVPNENLNDYPDKLTHLGWNGAEAGARALERIFGIEIDYTVKVTFESLIKIIDALGGIDVDVKISFKEQDENRSFDSNDIIRLEKGYQHLNGKQALAYARHRKTAGWGVKGREQAQRQIIAATVDKILSVEGAMKVGDMLNVAASYVSTNLPMSSARSFVMNAIDSGSPWTFGSSTVDSGYEYKFPCASAPSYDLYAVLLEEDDIQSIHDLYVSMHEEQNLGDFKFDLNDMDKYSDTFELDEKVITVENYYQVVPTYFPSYLRNNY